MSEETIVVINNVIADYFKLNTDVEWIPAKEIMPDLIKAGVFKKDEKSGLPLRKVLRVLDEKDELDKIPFVHPERIEKSTYWYLVREGAQFVPKEILNPISKKQRLFALRQNSDEYYIIDLCDEVLDQKAIRQHTFEFLLGDPHQNGRTRTPLPVDAYYEKFNLVIDYTEKERKEIPSEDDKPEKMTISGVKRSEQRKIYNTRKREVLRKREIHFTEIKFTSFNCDSEGKLVRDKDVDLATMKGILKKFIKQIK